MRCKGRAEQRHSALLAAYRRALDLGRWTVSEMERAGPAGYDGNRNTVPVLQARLLIWAALVSVLAAALVGGLGRSIRADEYGERGVKPSS
jgi:hypothetical protein